MNNQLVISAIISDLFKPFPLSGDVDLLHLKINIKSLFILKYFIDEVGFIILFSICFC